MITCTVHEREETEGDVTERAGRIVFVREGIAWWALFFPLVWLLYHRLWLTLMLYLAAVFAIGALSAAAGMPEIIGGIVTMGVSFLLALEGNDLRRWTLARRGYRLVEVTSGRDIPECEQRYFEGWLAGQSDRKSDLPAITPRPEKSGSRDSQAVPPGDDVIGLFPEPGR